MVGHHAPVVGEIPVPHGPEQVSDSESASRHGTPTADERSVFRSITHPDDSYTADGTYWADLPFAQRAKFVSSVDAAEAKKELATIGSMMKADPLSPLSWYFRNAVLPGAGLGLEGYILFSIGNLMPLFSAVWPDCWSKPKVCNANWVASVTYLEIVGIMIGQMGVGVIGDWLGRRWALIQDAIIMFIGAVMLTASWGVDLEGWVICYAISLLLFGLGVGGEYPSTATSTMESKLGAGKMSSREDRLHRGRKVTLAFLMQGWGQVLNQLLLIVFLFIFNRVGDPPYSERAAQLTFRLSLGVPALGLLWLLYYRVWKMPRPTDPHKFGTKSRVTGYDFNSLKLAFRHFGGRLLATAGTWFCNDVFFYGNKLFQGQFISVISSNPKSVMVGWEWNMVNVGVSMVGYYMACLLIDNKLYGRKMMQQVGFLMCFIMFVVPAFHFKYYSGPDHIHEFQTMYFLSSFFNQFGPNAVTFLVAGEVFPTSIRASAHGFSACMGKAGALFATVLYSYIGTQTKFYFVPWFGLLGMLLTWLFLPDTTGLDLSEQERRWNYVLEGREDEYHGVAVHPQHLSVWERFLGVGKSYNPELDLQSKIATVKEQWESRNQSRSDGVGDEEQGDMAEELPVEIDRYLTEKFGGRSQSEKGVLTGGNRSTQADSSETEKQ